MSTLEFLSRLREQDIRVWAEGDRLRFSAPEGGLTPALKAELIERKPEILTLLRETATRASPVRRASRDGLLPLSSAQERFWFLDQLEPGNPAYSLGSAIHLSGLLNVAALERSLSEIVRRHESLRTNFAVVGGQPVQIVSPAMDLALPIVDLQALPEAEQVAQVQRLASQEARRPYDLERDPLLRTKLLRLGEEEHVLVVRIHHIVSDGWSWRVLFRELSALYKAFSKGESSPLRELPIQYPDFAIWQRQWLQGEVQQTHLAYWKRQLGGSLPVLELPTDRPRPVIQTHRGADESLLLGNHLTEALKALSGQEGATLFMTLLAAFTVLLHRYSGQEDIIVGSPISGRDHVEVEGLIGLFLNTLILRTDLSDNPSFRQLLKQVRETVLGAFAHQVIPFEELLQEVQPERSLSHTPLFQALFVLHDPAALPLELPDLTVSRLKTGSETSMFDLSLVVTHTEGGVRAEIPYNTDLFDAATITRMLGHFQNMLESIVAAPDQPISRLPLLTEAEQYQLLVEWNNTQADYPMDVCVHQLFEAQVERTPEAIAVVFEDRQLTYLELNQRANQLAHHLQKQGVGTETLVGICVERSLEMIVGVVGVLKAGGAYLPLDPFYPQDRLAFMLDDAQVTVLLMQESLLAGLPAHGAHTICLDADWGAIAGESDENPVSNTTPEHLVYMIYTSGSTGESKGVMIQHRSLANAYLSWEDAYELRSGSSHLQMANFAFDVFSGDLVRALCSGGKLVLCPREWLLAPRELYGLMRQEAIDCAEFVPAVLRYLIQHLDETGQRLDFVRVLACGSDSWYVSEYNRFLDFCGPETRLINSFGLTEATIDSSYFEGGTPSLSGDQMVPIGRPFANTQLYILDAQLQPVPIGVAGELHIGGAGLALGYLSRPELTAEKFIPNPFSNEPGTALYKTGDLARYLPDGNIQFLARLDEQVKIRGFRIEPGEIEAVLGQHPEVREVVVLAREDVPGDKRLVAYVVPGRERAPRSSDLRGFLQERLPNYMIPSAFVTLEALPLTTSGKVDRRALPAPDRDRQVTDKSFMAPRDELEFQLVHVWEQVLGMQPIGLRDSFFDLGGHSLLAVRLFAQIEKLTDERLPLATIFQAPTVEQLAMILRQGGWSAPSSPVVMIQPGDSRPPFFCLPGNLGNVFTDLGDLARHLGPDQPFHGLQDGLQTPVRIDKLAAYFIDGMRVVQPEGPYFLGGICSGGVVAFEMAQQLRGYDQQVALLALVEPTPPRSPSLRAPFKFSASISRRLVRRFGPQSQRISQLSPPERGAYLRLKAKVLANGWAASRYAPQPYPGQIHLFLVRESLESPRRPKLRWCEFAADGTEVHEIPGTHDTIVGTTDTKIEEAHMRALAERLRGCIDEARAR